MDYRSIIVKPVSGALGAVIEGVDLGGDLDDRTGSGIHRALLDHCVIFFRDQHLTPQQQIAFARRFGTLNVHQFVGAMDDHPELIVVAKNADDKRNFGGGWHTDASYLEQPTLGTVLYAKEVPPYGGDTLFANMYLAYETLSPGLRRLLDGARAIHTARHVYGTAVPSDYTDRNQLKAMRIVRGSPEADKETAHPVVRTHPETGRKCLFVNRDFTVRFEDMTSEESRPLLEYLFAHCARPEFTCRFRWEPNSVAFWDNRCVQHYALNDYDGKRRIMHRVAIDGARPF
jgi:taurine dioxygenase